MSTGPVVCSIPFEKLTALADQLLAHGDFDIYSTTREVLLRQAQAALGVEAARQAAAQATRRTPGLHGAVTTTTSLAAAARPAAAAAAGPAADAAGQGLAPAGMCVGHPLHCRGCWGVLVGAITQFMPR